MNALSKWKIVLYLAAIFCAGTVSGWVIAAKTTKEKMFAPPRPEEIGASLRERLHARLNLTPAQAQQVDAIIARSSAEMKSMHEEHLKRIRQGVSNRNVQITAVLTPGQQKQFEEIERERQEMWRQKRAKYGGRQSG